MSENQKFIAAGTGMIGSTIVLMVALSFYHPGSSNLDDEAGSNVTLVKSVAPAAATSPSSAELPSTVTEIVAATNATSAPAVTDRYFRDSHGTLMCEAETEAKLQALSLKYNAISNAYERAYSQGVLKALEKEWARIKSTGPVHSQEHASSGRKRVVNESTNDGRGNRSTTRNGLLSDSQKQTIFYELVAAQDSGIGDVESYLLIGKSYGIPHRTLLEIVHEGVAKDWPKP